MFKIGEFSKITQVSIRMLRYYDEQKLLVPCYVDESSGYRMYSAKQIDQLQRIILLRDLGFGVKEIKSLIETWNPENIKNMITDQMKKTEESIQAEKNKLHQMKGLLQDLHNQEKELGIEIVMKALPMQQIISLRRTVPDYWAEGLMWQEFGMMLKDVKELEKRKSFSIYHDLDHREKDVDIEICLEADPVEIPMENKELIFRQVGKVEMAACFMIYGDFHNISRAYKEFAYWLEQHSEYEMQGENRQICHVSMCHTKDPEEYITELQIPLILRKLD